MEVGVLVFRAIHDAGPAWGGLGRGPVVDTSAGRHKSRARRDLSRGDARGALGVYPTNCDRLLGAILEAVVDGESSGEASAARKGR